MTDGDTLGYGNSVNYTEPALCFLAATGVLTGMGWIRTIDVIDDDGFDLFITSHTTPYRINSVDDSIDYQGTTSLSGSTQSFNFASGVITATSPLLTVEQDISNGIDASIYMEWDCDSDTSALVSQSKGYVFDTSDCNNSAIQDIVIRPVPILNPNRLIISLYGHVHGNATVPLTSINGVKYFDATIHGVNVEGKWLGQNSNSASIEFTNDVTIGNTSICDYGVYIMESE